MFPSIALVCALAPLDVPAEPVFCEPWDTAYAAQHASGDHVIAFWPFDSRQALSMIWSGTAESTPIIKRSS